MGADAGIVSGEPAIDSYIAGGLAFLDETTVSSTSGRKLTFLPESFERAEPLTIAQRSSHIMATD